MKCIVSNLYQNIHCATNNYITSGTVWGYGERFCKFWVRFLEEVSLFMDYELPSIFQVIEVHWSFKYGLKIVIRLTE